MPRAAGVAIGAVLAALLGSPGWPSASVWLTLAAVAVAAATIRGRLAGDLRDLPLAGALGAIAILLRLALSPVGPMGPPALPTGEGPWHATIDAVSAPREGQQPAMLVLDEPAGLRVAATLPRFPAVEPGYRIEIEGAIRPPPDDDPYGDYLRRIEVAGTLRSRSLDVEAEPDEPWDLERWRRGAAAALTRAVPEPEAGLAAGILVGLRDRVDRALAADFTTVGASHVVAISGWNIAIVAASVGAIGGSLGRRRRSVLTVGAIVAYVAFVGPSASVVRAGVMAGVVLLARETGRAGRAAAALAWAAAIILLVEPALVRDAGFQLSSLATGGLIAWATPLGAAIDRLARHRLPGWLVESLGVSLAAQAATLPVVLASFGRLAVVSPIVNLFVVPAVAPAMAAGAVAMVAGLLASFVPAFVAVIAGLPAWVLLGWIVACVRMGSAVPFASIELTPPADTIAGLAVGAAMAVIVLHRRLGGRFARAVRAAPATLAPAASARVPTVRLPTTRSHRIVGLSVVGAGVALVLALAYRPIGQTTITVLDVGQGDSILLQGSRGGRLLIDGGPDPDRLLVTLDERLPPWDRRIDALILTHPHEDHVAGLALLLERYRVGRVFETGMRGPGPGYAAWLAELRAGGQPVGRLAKGDHLAVDDVRLDVLWPDPGSVPEEPPDTGTGINNVSIVLLGEVDGRRFLLTGDVEEEIDPILLARGLPKLDLLKVAHHGSRTSSTDAFLEAVRPTVAVVSAGAGNPYGHPSPDTIGRLEASGGRVYRTDTNGSVDITISADAIRVRTSGPRTAAVAGAAAGPAPGPFSCGVPAGIPNAALGARDPPVPSAP